MRVMNALSCLQAIDRRERLRRLALETIDLTKDPYFMRNHLGQYECRLCLTLHNNEGNYLAHTQVCAKGFANGTVVADHWGSLRELPDVECREQHWQHATYSIATQAGEGSLSRTQGPTAVHTAVRRSMDPLLFLTVPQGKRHQQNLAKRAAREAQDKPTAPAPQRRVAVKKTVKIGRPGYRVTKQFDSDIKQRSLLFQVLDSAWLIASTLPNPQTSQSSLHCQHCGGVLGL